MQPRRTRHRAAYRERRPLGVASGLRVAFVAASISCPCGFTHFYSSTADTTEMADKCINVTACRRLLPEHNCFHSIPLPGTGSGSFPPALFYRQGFPHLITSVALPSYIPLHFSPVRPFQRGEAVMLWRAAAQKGAPPPGIVGPLASDSQQPVTNHCYVINGER